MLEVALITKAVCDEVGLNAFPKTSGSSGIHIYLPLKPTNEYEQVAEFSRLLAGEVRGARSEDRDGRAHDCEAKERSGLR